MVAIVGDKRATTDEGFEMTHPYAKMAVDVRGRVRNTSVTVNNAFLPLFEAVVNSIHATDERFREAVMDKGEVDVQIHRVAQQELPVTPGRPPVSEVSGFTITDNGCGFTDANMEAFCTADTTVKAPLGGKGVGRFSWLVVFSSAKIRSVYSDVTSRLRRRTFVFRPSDSGIENYVEEDVVGNATQQTSVELKGVNSRFKEVLRTSIEMMAERLFEHCFSYFVVGRCPRIRLIEVGLDGTATIEVNERLHDVNLSPLEPLQVGLHELNMLHAQQKYTQGRKHTAHLCAHQRVVTSFPLSDVSELNGDPIILRDGQRAVHHVYVSGRPLDEAVDSTRTRLDLPDGLPLVEAAGELDLEALRQAIGTCVNEHLAETLKAARQENFVKIEEHIRTEQPEYRHLIGRIPERLQKVKWTSDKRTLDERLYKVAQEWEADVRRRQADVENRLAVEGTDPDLLAEELYRVVAEVNETGQANLVRYVAKRRAVLKLIARLVSVREGPALEEDIHRIVFPLKKQGDDVGYDEHNLWLVDDTLSFYEHLSSDVSFTANEAAPVESRRRPDLLAFKTGDPYQHVAIVEFKRPDREDENPVQQLVKYGQLLRRGGARDASGISLPGIDRSVRIDAYAIVTLGPRMEEALEISSGDIRKVESEQRWYGNVPNLNMTVEVLDYHAFIRRAEQRNRAFFRKLGLT